MEERGDGEGNHSSPNGSDWRCSLFIEPSVRGPLVLPLCPQLLRALEQRGTLASGLATVGWRVRGYAGDTIVVSSTCFSGQSTVFL